ncbi:MAG: alpha/beta fold hydrolase [Cytophagaceae bacterium]
MKQFFQSILTGILSDKKTEEIIKAHQNSGKFISINNTNAFILDHGKGEPVFCIHGVPTSSFLYRKVLSNLSSRGYRGIAIDLPGFGLSDRPESFDYTFQEFSNFCLQALNSLGIKKFHLVVHDMGGPVGFAMAAQNTDRILSITILNTWIDVVNFRKPLPMRPFEIPILGEIELALMNHKTWRIVFNLLGVENSSGIPSEEINAYINLLKRKDKGKAFLKTMRNFDNTPEFRNLCVKAVQNTLYPIQIIWGMRDPGLRFERFGKELQTFTGVKTINELNASHLLQEEKPEFIADKIQEIIMQSKVLAPSLSN